ncbi:ATP-dependent DNA helicase RecQ-like [Chironomus tepperi]|uniref:ATP-dependent DNA helicase RecQ-like n=1 Tax=Chironomus tepperi TaxID=113505 RepID=UPI00391F244E
MAALDALEIVMGYNGHQNAYDEMIYENYSNVMLSTPTNEESFCMLIPDGFRASGVVMVISPYVDNINSQINYLNDANTSATTITNETEIPEREEIYESFSHQIFYVTPKMLTQGHEHVRDFIDHLLESEVSLVVIERANFMTHNNFFRETFPVLRDVRRNYPNIPWMAITNASYEDNHRIATALSMHNPLIVDH